MTSLKASVCEDYALGRYKSADLHLALRMNDLWTNKGYNINDVKTSIKALFKYFRKETEK